MTASRFIWYELMTSDVAAAETFYKSVVGWKSEPFAGSAMAYTIMKAGDTGVAGLMTVPAEAAAMGARPAWLGYIYVDDVDAASAKLKQAGGTVHREPADIPGVGRFSVVADPQGATFMLMHPTGPDQPQPPMATPGLVGWRELYAKDWKTAFDFYSSQFGWRRSQAMDMGEMGTYQLFSGASGGEDMGGMMTKPAQIPAAAWIFYFNVPDIDAAARKVTEGGGKVLNGPMEVPGGSWIIQALDPQGAMFALAGRRG
jgi:predicted enzyme related to lactoylglutathione lyase